VTTNLAGITPSGTAATAGPPDPPGGPLPEETSMSSSTPDPHDPQAGRPTGRSTEGGRRRGRVLIPAVFLSVIVLIFLFILLVSQLNR
jgi:hypothetical protein